MILILILTDKNWSTNFTCRKFTWVCPLVYIRTGKTEGQDAKFISIRNTVRVSRCSRCLRADNYSSDQLLLPGQEPHLNKLLLWDKVRIIIFTKFPQISISVYFNDLIRYPVFVLPPEHLAKQTKSQSIQRSRLLFQQWPHREVIYWVRFTFRTKTSTRLWKKLLFVPFYFSMACVTFTFTSGSIMEEWFCFVS